MYQDIMTFLKSLELIDYLFFFTVLILMILVVCLIYFVRINKDDILVKDYDLNDPNDLKELASTIKTEPKPIKFTTYEEEQEKKAIISYDELISSKKDLDIDYDDEQIGDVIVKKVNLDNLNAFKNTNEIKENSKITNNLHVISLAHEEAFLLALKELNKNLN